MKTSDRQAQPAPRDSPKAPSPQEWALVIAALALIGWLMYPRLAWICAALGMCLAGLLVPRLLRGPARLWGVLTAGVGRAVTVALLTAVFFIVLCPVGLWRRWVLRVDPLRLRQRRSPGRSAWVVRRHAYSGADLRHPF